MAAGVWHCRISVIQKVNEVGSASISFFGRVRYFWIRFPPVIGSELRPAPPYLPGPTAVRNPSLYVLLINIQFTFLNVRSNGENFPILAKDGVRKMNEGSPS